MAWLIICCGGVGVGAEEPSWTFSGTGPGLDFGTDAAASSTSGAEALVSPSNPHVTAEADYILYWLKPVCLKPATLSIGVPGQPGTQLVQGLHKFEFGGASGVRPGLALG